MYFTIRGALRFVLSEAVALALRPLQRKGRILDFTNGPMAGGVVIPEDELEGYPECEHDVSVYEDCAECPRTQERVAHHYCNYGSDRPPRTTKPFGAGEPVLSYEERKKLNAP